MISQSPQCAQNLRLKLRCRPFGFRYVQSFSDAATVAEVTAIVESDVSEAMGRAICVAQITTRDGYALLGRSAIRDVLADGAALVVYVVEKSGAAKRHRPDAKRETGDAAAAPEAPKKSDAAEKCELAPPPPPAEAAPKIAKKRTPKKASPTASPSLFSADERMVAFKKKSENEDDDIFKRSDRPVAGHHG